MHAHTHKHTRTQTLHAQTHTHTHTHRATKNRKQEAEEQNNKKKEAASKEAKQELKQDSLLVFQEKSLRESNEQRHATSIGQMVGLRDKEDALRHEMDKLTEQLRHEQEKSKQYLEQVGDVSVGRWLVC